MRHSPAAAPSAVPNVSVLAAAASDPPLVIKMSVTAFRDGFQMWRVSVAE